MRLAALPALLLATAGFADVLPHCGGPKVVVQEPGEDCGHHGSRWRGDCYAPAACFDVAPAGRICTKTCVNDADCAPLGSGFRCTGKGRPYDASSSDQVSVCR